MNKIDHISSDPDKKNLVQIILAIICLSFIYYPTIIFCIFNDKSIVSSSSSKMGIFIDLLKEIISIKPPYLNILLNKCIIMGVFRLWLKYLNYFEQNENIKINLFDIISNIMIHQKKEKINIFRVLTKKDIRCNFVNDNDDDEDEEIDYSENNDFNEKIEMILSSNDDIINCDEFKIFSQIVKYIRKYDSRIYELYISKEFKGDFKSFEDLLFTRNLKVKYEEKDYIISRKILNLKNKK